MRQDINNIPFNNKIVQGRWSSYLKEKALVILRQETCLCIAQDII